MKVTLKNGWTVTVMDGGVPLRKTFFAENDLGQLLLCDVKGNLQLIYESGCDGWLLASTARTVDALDQPLVEPVTIKANPIENNPSE